MIIDLVSGGIDSGIVGILRLHRLSRYGVWCRLDRDRFYLGDLNDRDFRYSSIELCVLRRGLAYILGDISPLSRP